MHQFHEIGSKVICTFVCDLTEELKVIPLGIQSAQTLRALQTEYYFKGKW